MFANLREGLSISILSPEWQAQTKKNIHSIYNTLLCFFFTRLSIQGIDFSFQSKTIHH